MMILSDSNLFTNTSWEGYVTTKTYTKKDTQTKIYLKFRFASGGITSAVELSIPLSGTVAPTNPTTPTKSTDYPNGTLLGKKRRK